MPADKFTLIKNAVAEKVAEVGLPTYTDRYVEQDHQRFATVYFGEWLEEMSGLEETMVTGTLSVEVFAMNDNELTDYADQLQHIFNPLLVQFDEDLLDSWKPVGGEFTPQEQGIRPSVILNYAVTFYLVL